MPRGQVVAIFLAFAFAYFFSALVRAVTATLAPVFSSELGLAAGQLGLLAGAYFVGFSLMQLPLGHALDRWGPRRVELALLGLAVVGCAAFAMAKGLAQLMLARFLVGVGVSACLMAPLTCYRRVYASNQQLRANSWMLMTGSLGMVASTLPVQWLLPSLGWRGLFVALSALLALAMLAIRLWVPSDPRRSAEDDSLRDGGYRTVFRHPVFRRTAGQGVVVYGAMVAMQSLWVGPWLTQVSGQTPAQAASGLFFVNLAMLLAFLCWGLSMPWLIRRGWAGEHLVLRLWPLGPLCLAWIVWLGPDAGAAHWALWCVCTSVVSLLQPVVGQAFAPSLAGRALSAYNLLIFVGVFAVQWGIGLVIDGLLTWGMQPVQAYRGAFALLCGACVLASLWHVLGLRRQHPG